MTLEEMGEIFNILGDIFPNFNRGKTNTDRLRITELWASMFADDNAADVIAAVKSYIATEGKGFAPSIGIIKNKIAELRNPDAMTEYEAWNRVREAISNGYYGADKEFAKLPGVLQRLVGSPNQLRDWATMETETLNTVVASNFMRSYRVRAEREREYLLLPADVKKFMAELSAKVSIPEVGELTEDEFNSRRNKAIGLLNGGDTTE